MKRASMFLIVPCVVAFAAGGYAFARSWMSHAPGQDAAEAPHAANDHAPGKPAKLLCRGTFLSMEASPAAGGIYVTGEAEVTDFQADANYFWMVRVLPAKGYEPSAYSDALFETTYQNQAFQVTPSQNSNPKFEDVIFPTIPVGKYCVELKLMRLAPGMTAADITDGKQLLSNTFVGGTSVVSL